MTPRRRLTRRVCAANFAPTDSSHARSTCKRACRRPQPRAVNKPLSTPPTRSGPASGTVLLRNHLAIIGEPAFHEPAIDHRPVGLQEHFVRAKADANQLLRLGQVSL